MRLLGGVEYRVTRENGDRKSEDREGELNKEEIREIRDLKDGKAAGCDGISGEVWKYGGEEMMVLLHRVWEWRGGRRVGRRG